MKLVTNAETTLVILLCSLNAYKILIKKVVPGGFATNQTYPHDPTHHSNVPSARTGQDTTLFTVGALSIHTT